MLMGKQRQRLGVKTTGGLLVLFWTETRTTVQSFICTVAAAGPWCTGFKMRALQPGPEPEPADMCALTDMYGSLKVLLSFQAEDERFFSPEWQAHTEAFLRIFSLANAGIKIHLKFKFNQQMLVPEFRVKFKSKVLRAGESPLILDVTSNTQLPQYVKKGCWCHGGHPVLGSKLPLSIPPQAMDQGLYGELSIQIVTLLSPCVLQYPNLESQLTHIQVLVYSPSNIPVTGPSTFFQNLPAHLDCQDLSLHSLHGSSCKDLVLCAGTVYKVERENWEEESSLPTVQQRLQLFFFLQYSDPFTSHLSDVIDTEELIEHHLQNILSNNTQAVIAALQTEMKNTLKAQNHRKRNQEKLRTAIPVILSSTITIVSCSSNMDFRNACLKNMKVRDTHELSASLCESLWRMTSWKFTTSSRCYSAQCEVQSESDGPTRTEI